MGMTCHYYLLVMYGKRKNETRDITVGASIKMAILAHIHVLSTLSLLLFVCTNFSVFEIVGFWRY